MQLHDSVDSLSYSDEVRQLSALINSYLRKVSHGADHEAHLNFLVDSRASFANLDAVKPPLVLAGVKLMMDVHAAARGRHTKKSAGFVKAAAAYVFITTPSTASPLMRLRLYLLGAQACLANQLLPQMDDFVKAAVTLVPDALSDGGGGAPNPTGASAAAGGGGGDAASREASLVSLLASAISFLVLAPGHPSHGPFYLANGLLNVVAKAPWKLPDSLPTLYLRLLALFCAYAQRRRLPYYISQ